MDNFNLRHTAFAIILFFSIMLFLRLGEAEIQPWDEGLYAFRAKAVVQHNVWWDQTEYALGGLYSSTYPPLTVWAMAVAMKYFEPETAVRIFSAFCGTLSLLLIFLISLRLFDREMSLLAIISLAVTLVWFKYSRQGMTDVPVVTFSLLSFWALLKTGESKKIYETLLWTFVLALAFAAALMSKILVSFLPLLFIIVFLFFRFKITNKIWAITGGIVGIALALPWHIYMIKTYGSEFYRAFFAPHIYSAVELNTQSLGAAYYLNQLIISNPFFVLSIILLFVTLLRYKKIYGLLNDNTAKYIFTVSFVWFGGLLILFSLSITKLPHYVVYMVVPAVLLAGFLFKNFDSVFPDARSRWLIFTLLVAAMFWSLSYRLRQDIKLLLTFRELTFSSILFLGIVVFMLVFLLVTQKSSLKSILRKSMPAVSYLFIIVLVVRLILGNVLDDDLKRGAVETAFVLDRFHINECIYMYHRHNDSDTLNPQLLWYASGGLRENRVPPHFIHVGLPRNRIDIKKIIETDSLNDKLIVYYVPDDRNLAFAVVRELKKTRKIIGITKNYIIFGFVMYSREKEKSV